MRKTYRFGASAAAVGALALATVVVPAGVADGALPSEVATISMKFQNGKLKFTGPDAVKAGAKLRIVNRTKPRRFGPHTFTLVEESIVPHTRKERRTCFSPGKICLIAAKAHEFNPRTNKVGRPLVKAGEPGWDTVFTRTRKGDSWYTEKLGQDFSQKVTGKAGTSLHFMCIVHPEMHGEIDIEEGQG